MYRAVIIDDEKKICRLILELGNWEELNIEVVAVCHDSEAGLAAIDLYRPDIVLTDMRMPGCGGLELIRSVQESGQDPAFVIISGYQDFEYAYYAIKYGVMDFLLKPIEEERLNEVLRNMVKQLSLREEQAQRMRECRRMHTSLAQAEQKSLFEILFLPQGRAGGSAREMCRKYSCNFPYSHVQVIYLKNGQENENSSVLERFRVRLKELCPEGTVCLVEPVCGGLAGIYNFPLEKREAVGESLEVFFAEVRRWFAQFARCSVTMGVGPVAEFSDLIKSADIAREAERAKVSLGANRIIKKEHLFFAKTTLADILTREREESFRSLVEMMSKDKVKSWFEHLHRDLVRLSDRPPSPDLLFALRDRLLDETWAYIRRYDVESGFSLFLAEVCAATEKVSGVREFFSVQAEQYTLYFRHCQEIVNQKKTSRIRAARKYVDEHYAEPLTLEEVAEKAGLSPAYFSTNFKKYEKISFLDYLTFVRMEHAKELLSTTRFTIFEIAQRVGYQNDKVFSKAFKRVVGIRPGQYRRMYYREKG